VLYTAFFDVTFAFLINISYIYGMQFFGIDSNISNVPGVYINDGGIVIENMPNNWLAHISQTMYDPATFTPTRKVSIQFPLSVEFVTDLAAYAPTSAPAELKGLLLEQLGHVLDRVLTAYMETAHPHMAPGLIDSFAKVKVIIEDNNIENNIEYNEKFKATH